MGKILLLLTGVIISLAQINTPTTGIHLRGPEVQSPTIVQQTATAPPAISAPIKKVSTSTQNVEPVSLPKSTPHNPAATTDKEIVVSLEDQDLKYFEGMRMLGEFKISSGLQDTPTPPGQYAILQKKPVVDYKGPDYDFPNTKWNLLFKMGQPLNYYIHGAYWHHNFGHPMSHGCVNVSYADMEPLYNWADVGTKVVIQ